MKYILHPLLWCIAHLPLWALKGLSSFLAALNWYVVHYRKKVVSDNLQKAFPEKTQKERNGIARKFYVQLCDYLLGMVRIRYNREPILNKLVFHKNPQVLQRLCNKGKSFILVAGHYFTWEYTNTTPLVCSFSVIATYSPLSNKFTDDLVKRCRTKFGVIMHPMNEIYRALLKYQQQKIKTMTLMVADQSPTTNNLEHWITFMGQDTPVLMGVEQISRKLNHAVVFLRVTQPKRFVYEYEYVPITENAADEPPMEITKRWYAELEKMIRQRPELYLWSHRRWKHQDKKPNPQIAPIRDTE